MTIDKTIAFRDDMLDRVLAGKKTVTIRPMKPQPVQINDLSENGLSGRMYMLWQGADLPEKGREWLFEQYPHGQVGDVMTVRDRPDIKLKITDIQAMRLHRIEREIWNKDGVSYPLYSMGGIDLIYYHWQGFYGNTEYQWKNNPWVWVIEFELVKEAANG